MVELVQQGPVLLGTFFSPLRVPSGLLAKSLTSCPSSS